MIVAQIRLLEHLADKDRRLGYFTDLDRRRRDLSVEDRGQQIGEAARGHDAVEVADPVDGPTSPQPRK